MTSDVMTQPSDSDADNANEFSIVGGQLVVSLEFATCALPSPETNTTSGDLSAKIERFLSNRELRLPKTRPLTNAELMRLAKKNPPPQAWLEGDEEYPF